MVFRLGSEGPLFGALDKNQKEIFKE